MVVFPTGTVEWDIMSFRLYKSPKEDVIFPALIQQKKEALHWLQGVGLQDKICPWIYPSTVDEHRGNLFSQHRETVYEGPQVI